MYASTYADQVIMFKLQFPEQRWKIAQSQFTGQVISSRMFYRETYLLFFIIIIFFLLFKNGFPIISCHCWELIETWMSLGEKKTIWEGIGLCPLKVHLLLSYCKTPCILIIQDGHELFQPCASIKLNRLST